MGDRTSRALDLLQSLFALGQSLAQALRKKNYKRVDEILDSQLPTHVEALLIRESRSRKAAVTTEVK